MKTYSCWEPPNLVLGCESGLEVMERVLPEWQSRYCYRCSHAGSQQRLPKDLLSAREERALRGANCCWLPHRLQKVFFSPESQQFHQKLQPQLVLDLPPHASGAS